MHLTMAFELIDFTASEPSLMPLETMCLVPWTRTKWTMFEELVLPPFFYSAAGLVLNVVALFGVVVVPPRVRFVSIRLFYEFDLLAGLATMTGVLGAFLVKTPDLVPTRRQLRLLAVLWTSAFGLTATAPGPRMALPVSSGLLTRIPFRSRHAVEPAS